jgi:hypothetical protein
MMNKQTHWKHSYRVAWERLFDALPAADREAVLASPDGLKSAELTRRASEAADLDAKEEPTRT